MAKAKQPERPTAPRRLVQKTTAAFKLLEKKKPAEAVKLLVEMDHDYPNCPEVLKCLVNAYYDLGDLHNYEQAIRRLVRLDGRDPDLHFGLAGSYLVNARPAMALQAFREALRRWPNYSRAAEARQEIARLEQIMQTQAAEVNLPETQAFELILQHEEVRYCLVHTEYQRGKRVALKLLHDFPNFVPGLNNLSQLYAIEGEIDKAIQTAEQVLALESENIHALSNLARLHFLRGRPAQASEYAHRLKQSTASSADRWGKMGEALTFLEDDEGVLELYQQAKTAGELEPPGTDEVFYHLLATAACRLGNETAARQYWEKALKINPNFDWALENLEDMKKPDDQRNGPWAYPFENWLLGPVAIELSIYLNNQKRSARKEEVQAAMSCFFEEKHPEVIFLAPHLVERGDANAREFVVRLAAVSGHPVLLKAAKSYILGKTGTSAGRIQAAKTLSEAGLLPSGTVRMWSEGKWNKITLLSLEISPEPDKSNRPGKVQELYEQAYDALNDDDGQRAQVLLEQAVALCPDDPGLLNNLALAFEKQGQSQKARQMILDIHARFPDYFFGILGVASLAMKAGDLDKAHTLLNGLMQRKRMHTSEFTALCRVQIQVWLADGKREEARTWVGLWERADPKNPNLAHYRLLVGGKKK